MARITKLLLSNKTEKQTVAKNAFWLTFGNVVSRLIKVVLTIYAARVLGTSGYGVFSYALSLVVLFTGLSDVGVSSLITREIAVAKKIQGEYVSTALFIKAALTAASAVIILAAVPFFVRIPEVLPLLPLIVLLVALDNARDLPLAISRGQERMEVEAGIQIFTTAAIVTFGIAALLLTQAVAPLIFAYILGSSAGLVAAWTLFGKHFKHFWRLVHFDLARKIIREAWPFALIGLLGVIMMSTDVIMLGWLRTASEVGLYAAAQKPVEMLYVIPGIIAAAAFPVTARLAKEKGERLKRLLEKSVSFSLLVGLPIATGGIAVAGDVMTLFYGAAYREAAVAFQILLATILVMFPSALITHAVFASNAQRHFVSYLAFGALANVALNMLLIPPYGVAGSAIATVGALATANGFIWFKMKRITYFTVLPHLKRIIPASIVMGAVSFALDAANVYFIVNVIASGALYFLLLKLLKEPLLQDARSLLSTKGQ